MGEDDNVEIIDVENYKSEGEKQFSHQLLVMTAMRKCIELRAKEMKAGYEQPKVDKYGNVLITIVPDARLEFIESVNAAEMITSCDLDDDATKKIDAIKKSLDEEYKKLVEAEKKDWDNTPQKIKNMRRERNPPLLQIPNALNRLLPFYQEFIEFEVKYATDIFKEINNLTKRLNFYQEEAYEA